MTYWYNEYDKLILEEKFTYRNYFKPNQDIIINSQRYVVVRHNVNTNGSMIVFVKSSKDKQNES